MGAVWMLGIAEVRRRWRSVVVLTFLVGFVGAAVLALAAGARRTESSLARFEHDSLAANLEIDTGGATLAEIDKFRHSPGVATVAQLHQVTLISANERFLPAAAQVDDRFGRVIDRARLIQGRNADLHKTDELTIGEGLASQLHVHAGDHIRFRSYSVAQVDVGLAGQDPGGPAGPIVTFRVVGIVRRPLDLGGRGAQGGVIVPTPAFLAANKNRVGSFSGSILRVRTNRGAADLPQVEREARRLFGRDPVFQFTSLIVEGEGAQNAIDVTTSALFLAVVVAGLAGLVGIGIALAREIALADANQFSLRALGMRPHHRIAAAAAVGVPVALAGAVLAVVGSALASPLFPIGVARKAEPHLGVRFDGPVAAAGFLAVGLVVLIMVMFAAARTARASERLRLVPRPTVMARSASGLSVPPAMGVGLRFALDRGRGKRALPVRSSLAGASFGAVIVVAVLLFSSSLHHLASTPRDYGWTWDLAANDSSTHGTEAPECSPISTRLTGVRAVADVASICMVHVDVNGRPTMGWGFSQIRGHIGPRIVEGRAPTAQDEVALGAKTLAAVHRHVDDRVSVAAVRGPHTYRIVGRVVLPSLGDDPQALADGAAFTGPGLARLDSAGTGAGSGSSQLVVRFARSTDRAAATRQIESFRASADPPDFGPILPVEIDRVRQIDRLPIALAAFVAFVALVAVGYALITAARRRRRDLAILKTLGFTRGQVRAAMAWHASTMMAVGLVVGIPCGLVVGRFVWKWVANGFGVSTDPTWPVIGILVLVPVALIIVNLVAAVPARAAARTRPAVVLRSE